MRPQVALNMFPNKAFMSSPVYRVNGLQTVGIVLKGLHDVIIGLKAQHGNRKNLRSKLEWVGF